MRANMLIVTASLLSAAATCAQAGLVASYPFNGGSLDDTSGNLRTATVVGTATITGAVTDPDRGAVYELTGGNGHESAPGTYLNLPVDGTSTGSWTMAMWIKDGPNKNSYLFDNRDFVGSTGGAARLIFSTEHNVTPAPNVLGIFNGSWAKGVATPIRDGSWHHVAWVSDGANITIYTDGSGATTAKVLADLLTATVRLGNRDADGAAGQLGRLIDDVYIYNHALSQSEINQLIADTSPPTVKAPVLMVAQNGANLDFSWSAQDGALYDLVSSPDLSTPIATWPVVGANKAIAADPGGTNTLSIVRPVDAKAFYALAAYLAPPTVLFGSDFEADNGGMTFVDNSGGAGTPWAWGVPDSNNTFSSVVTEGNGGSAKCWATGLGTFIASGNNGFYNSSTNGSLRTPVIDLTGVVSATLGFAQAMDVAFDDVAVVNFLDADNGDAILASKLYTDSDFNASPWELETLAVPAIALGKNIRIEWHLSTTASTEYIGWYIDDVMVTED